MQDGKLFSLTLLLFFFSGLKNIFYWLYLWQVKEYRLDRLLLHFKETLQGKKLFFNVDNIAKLSLIGLFFLGTFDREIIIFKFLVFFIFLYSAAFFIKDLIYKKIKRPIFSSKIIAVFILTVSVITFLSVFPVLFNFLRILLVDRSVFLLVSFFIWLFSFPSNIYKDYLIEMAVKKKDKFKKLLVIGITGSYGKGSTKEILFRILSSKFKTMATFGTFNTPIGIAKTILEKLDKEKEIFIVEMGAYKIGEIKKMCELVKPKIGILTAINAQHLSLFGSLENIKQAKNELIECLPEKSGLALFNVNNQDTLDLWEKTKKNKIAYFADYENSFKNGKEKPEFDIVASKIKVNEFNIIFDVFIKSKKLKITSCKINLLGKHNVETSLPGIYLADFLGMTEKEIKNSLETVYPLKKTMEPYLSPNGTVFIDDTYNANPNAIFAALSYLDLAKGKKALVLQPMIELGKEASLAHYQVGTEAGKICDYLFLTNFNFHKDIGKGVKEAGQKCKIFVLNPKDMASFISKNLNSKNDTVIFEGKEAAFVLDLLSKEKVYPAV